MVSSFFRIGSTGENEMIGTEIKWLTKQEAFRFAKEILDDLTPREGKVLGMRFGFIDETLWTYEKIGEQFNLTKEGIRQIEKKALKKLRNLSKEWMFFHAANCYAGLSKKNLQKYKNAVRCERCGVWIIEETGSPCVCSTCQEKVRCLKKVDFNTFTIEAELEFSFMLKHTCGTNIEYAVNSKAEPICEYCQKKERALLIVKKTRFVIVEERNSCFLLRHPCGSTTEYPYSSKNLPECIYCRARHRIDFDEFSIERQEEERFILRHKCHNRISYPCNAEDAPVCHKCSRPDLKNLIRSAKFYIEGENEKGFDIRHTCGYRRRYRFDNTEPPACQGCTQRESRAFVNSLHNKPLELTLLRSIDEVMSQKLNEAGIDNTKAFFAKTTRQIYRSFIDRNIPIKTDDILTIEAAKKGVSVSELNQQTKEDLIDFAEKCSNRMIQIAEKEEENKKMILGLPNIGPNRAEKLQTIGYVYSSDLKSSTCSTESIWEALYAAYPSVDLQDIYAIEGARNDQPMQKISKERKKELRAFVESIKGPWGPQRVGIKEED